MLHYTHEVDKTAKKLGILLSVQQSLMSETFDLLAFHRLAPALKQKIVLRWLARAIDI